MTQDYKRLTFLVLLCVLAIAAFTQGCARQGYSVIASTGTVIGVEISQNPATQTPQAKLGYSRAEFAFVPTNRSGGADAGNTGGGARDTGNVLMELRYGGIFDVGPSSGIYQRLAVGDIAVRQPGADAMFIKNAKGDIDPKALQALQAVRSIPLSSSILEKEKAPITARFLRLIEIKETDSLEKFEKAARDVGYPKTKKEYRDYPAFRDFAVYPNVTLQEIGYIRKKLEDAGIIF